LPEHKDHQPRSFRLFIRLPLLQFRARSSSASASAQRCHASPCVLDIATQLNVVPRPAMLVAMSPRPITRICDDLRFLLMLTRVQNIVRQLPSVNKCLLNTLISQLRLCRPKQVGLFVCALDRVNDGLYFSLAVR
jgi:hypothetical protein